MTTVVPAGGDVEGTGVCRELLAVLLPGAEEQRHAVVDPWDDDGAVPRDQTRSPTTAEPVGDDDPLEALSPRTVDLCLHLLPELVGSAVKAGIQEVKSDLVRALARQCGQLRFEHATGNDLQFHDRKPLRTRPRIYL